MVGIFVALIPKRRLEPTYWENFIIKNFEELNNEDNEEAYIRCHAKQFPQTPTYRCIPVDFFKTFPIEIFQIGTHLYFRHRDFGILSLKTRKTNLADCETSFAADKCC